MIKQEEIRRGMLRRYLEFDTMRANGISYGGSGFHWRMIGELLKYLHENGVVIKVEGAKPPIFFGKEITVDSKQLAMIVEKVRDTCDKAGCGFFEPLVKEDK